MYVIILFGVVIIILVLLKGFSMGCISCIINWFNWKGLLVKICCNFINLYISNVDSYGGVSCLVCYVMLLYSVL